ncbi:MAG: N-acetylglucosamine-6-phosphate deacetylase [Acidobacteria bacterium]|nr:N-acetylglucosamine-6-phosphate deacetylase [Acidobacteriota bacterium]
MSNTDSEGEKLLLQGARIVTPDGVREGASLSVEHQRIARLSSDGEDLDAHSCQVLDLRGLTILPGFIDVHIHGAVGVDVMEARTEELHTVARFLARHGVTAWLPTLVPAPLDDYARAVRAVEQLLDEQDAQTPAAARALGLHYEGPFVNAQQCGALRAQYFRTYSAASDLNALATVERANAAHMMTLAPEIEGGVELVRELHGRGWVVSIGHTRATIEVLEQARIAGARHMTHFLNAMPTLHQRDPGPVGWGLLQDDICVDLIADGVHTDPLMLQLVIRCKGAERVTLISDSVAPAGLGDGEYRVWGETIKVSDGRTSNERGSIAGSVITMLDAARMVSSLGRGWQEIARMASLNPARLLGIESEYGSIEAGKRADLAALDGEGRVRLTLVGGRVAFTDL